MSNFIEVNDGNFESTVLKSDKPTLVDFGADWCKPCLMIAPILDELSTEYGDRVSFVKLDVDQNPKIAAKYGIMGIPTLLIFKNGEPVTHIVGLRPKNELKRSLEASLA